MHDDNLVYLHTMYTHVCSYVKREDDLQIAKKIYIYKKDSLLAGGAREVISFPALWQQTWRHSFPFLCCLRDS